MSSTENEERKFLDLVAELFRRLGRNDVITNYVYAGSLDHDYDIDILFGRKGDATIVEVKHYRYKSPPNLDLLVRALANIHFIQRESRAEHAMLVISCPLTSGLASTAMQYPNVEIWDVKKVFETASQFPDLLKQLEMLLEVDVDEVLGEQRPVITIEKEITERDIGKTIAKALRGIAPGRAAAYDFENKCIDALKYLFENDLAGWHDQLETDDGLQRRDMVCRILPNSEVWELMLNDLRSRYVIFEFKNYKDAISQYEIITTERYLYPAALRKLAIMISPNGCSPSAKKVIQGAMREHGKLIMSLTVRELCDLLENKDKGSDPNKFLFNRIDDFLMNLGR